MSQNAIVSDDGEIVSLYIVLCWFAGVVSMMFSSRSTVRRMYDWLRVPVFAPPAWVYWFIWVVIVYPAMGIGFWRLRLSGGTAWPYTGSSEVPLILLAVTLGSDILWGWTFFGAGWRGLSLVPLTASFGLRLAVTILAWPIDSVAFAMILIGVVWLFYAWLIGVAIAWLNAGRRNFYHADAARRRALHAAAAAEQARQQEAKALREQQQQAVTPGGISRQFH